MAKLFEDGHAVQLEPGEVNTNPETTWYQSHFYINSSKKFRVVINCAARYGNVNLNEFFQRPWYEE